MDIDTLSFIENASPDEIAARSEVVTAWDRRHRTLPTRMPPIYVQASELPSILAASG